jgi:hypothetical protein
MYMKERRGEGWRVRKGEIEKKGEGAERRRREKKPERRSDRR